jgi:hypothetical protein
MSCPLPVDVDRLCGKVRINEKRISEIRAGQIELSSRLEGSIKLLGEHIGRFAQNLSKVDIIEERLTDKILSLSEMLLELKRTIRDMKGKQ